MMFDFKKRLGQQKAVNLKDPIAVFESLDRKATHTVLRPVQKEGLAALKGRWDDSDVIMKLSTGAGKTTIALVYLHARMQESKKPVVYLCPTTQLVSQVLREAKNLGINAVSYPQGVQHPGADAMLGKAIIVCTYDKLFNAKTTFDRPEVQLSPELIILDDAHAGIQEVRDSFSINAKASSKLHQGLHDVLAPLCAGHTCMWTYIERGDKTASFEVPFWIWTAVLDDVQAILADHSTDSPYCFVWGYLRENLRWCRCVVSSAGIEIVPDLPLIEQVRAFQAAKQRLYMSATLADDSALVRELGCSESAALNPVIPPSDAGVGERMVLAPALIDPSLNREWVMQWCAGLSTVVSVVVLAPSEARARDWEKVGAHVELGAGVESTVESLRDRSLTFVAFAQRYDGVDLPDDSCRVLVLDGLPTGQGIADGHDSADPARPGGALQTWIHRIEQGMGRAIRSHADYAVVVLADPEVAYFVSRTEVRDGMGAATRAQIDLAYELTEMATDPTLGVDAANAAHEMALKCLRRDEGWKDYYDARVRAATKMLPSVPDEGTIRMAAVERACLDHAVAGEPKRAAAELNVALNTWKQSTEREGWYLQRKANYTHQLDPATALQIQLGAYRKNRRLCTPPMGVELRPIDSSRLHAPALVQRWFSGFQQGNGAIAALNTLKAKLSFEVNADKFEQGLSELAGIFGVDACRPEKLYRRGPDDLWSWADFDWVIEAKNERGGPLPKDDAEQLMAAMQWHATSYPERAARAVPVVAAKLPNPKWDAPFPNGTRVITPETLSKLLGNVERFLVELAGQGTLFLTPVLILDAMRRHQLAPDSFLAKYTVPMGTPTK